MDMDVIVIFFTNPFISDSIVIFLKFAALLG